MQQHEMLREKGVKAENFYENKTFKSKMKERCKIRSYMSYKSYRFSVFWGLENASVMPAMPAMHYKNLLRSAVKLFVM